MKPYKIARLVTNEFSPPKPDLTSRLNLISEAANVLIEPVDVIQTAGGFLWIKTDFTNCPLGEDSSEENFSIVIKNTEEFLRDKVKTLPKKIGKKASFITLGVDVFTWDEESVGAELVGTFDVAAGCFIKWTGKSYPTSDQAHSLLYCLELDSHFQILNGRKVLVLGCHDLTMFMRRSIANIKRGGGNTYKAWITERFFEKAATFRPEIVLQHPHSTVLTSTWQAKWSGLMEMLPYISTYSSGIHYYDDYKHPDSSTWNSLYDVLR